MGRWDLVVACVCLGLLAWAFAADEKNVVSHPFVCTDMGKGKVFVVSREGKIEWEYPAPGCTDVWRLANGNILFTHTHGVKEVTPDKKIVWEYKAESGNEVFSCQPLEDGNVLVGEAGPCRLIEVDRQGQIKKEIKLTTVFLPKGTSGTAGLKAGHAAPAVGAKTLNQARAHGQFRICRKTSAGTYLVAHMAERVVREYDEKGAVLRTIKVPGNVFSAIRLPDGNMLIACGDGHKLIEVDAKDNVVWQIGENDLPDNPLRFVAGVHRLANGDTVICNWGGHGFVGKQPQVFEVTRDKKVVWQVFDNQQFGAISNIQVLDVDGDVTKGALLR